MCINRFTKIAFSIMLVIAAKPFFGMESKAPTVCAAAQVDDTDKEKTKELIKRKLQRASADGKFHEVKRLLNSPEVDVGMRNELGTIALVFASQHRHLGIVRYTVEEYGCDINSPLQVDGKDSATALSAADNLEIVKFLVEHKAKINRRSSSGSTILMGKSFIGLDEVVQYLVEHGANIYAKNNAGETALDHATWHAGAGCDRVIYYLTNKMTTQSTLFTLLACDKLIKEKPDTVPHDHFPPEDIGRILRPCIAAALSGK